MLVLVDLFEFEVIVTPELGVASSHGVGGFQQVVAEIAVAGLNHLRMFGFTLMLFYFIYLGLETYTVYLFEKKRMKREKREKDDEYNQR